MSVLISLRLWFRDLFRRRSVERDLDREMHFHLDMETEQNRRAGMPGEEAGRRAHIAFGGVERHREAVRDQLGVRALEDAAMDIRYGLRGLRRSPGFTAAAIVVLALGIGAATAVTTTVNHVLRGALPFPQPDRLAFVSEATRSGDVMLTSFPNFTDWRQRAHSFQAMAAFMPVSTTPVVLPSHAVRTRVQYVSRDFFRVFGVAPMLGRTIRPDENAPGGPHVAVVSEQFWRSALGAPTNLTGVTVNFAGDGIYQVVGVMPAGFRVLEGADIWLAGESFAINVRGAGNYWVVGRLAPGATLVAARREMD
ncbi:MAG TPA: ABC transporter permease, partial [Gemmatimonadaceae bacterium]